MNNRNNVYYAKIMLFGEYSVICNSMGLTIPYAHFKGELNFLNKFRYTDYDFAVRSNRLLKEYYNFLEGLNGHDGFSCEIDLKALKKDLNKGLYFESSIPQGYGIGSSGALVAAIYDKYALSKIKSTRRLQKENITELKILFAQMESYFHGISSGIDPLHCYIKFPLLIKNQSEIEIVDMPRKQYPKDGAIFLLNTGKPGKTQPLVKLFFSKCKQDSFKNLIENELIPLNDTCINTLLAADTSNFLQNLRKLSVFQLRHFKNMIPDDYQYIWKEGLDQDLFSLKLCGSGGGGFILAFTKDYTKAVNEFRKQKVEFITVFKSFQDN